MKKSEIIQVSDLADGTYFLRIDFDEHDVGSAIGHVFKAPQGRESNDLTTQVLATNDELRVMWASPSGALWVGSANGHVGTTAAARWPSAQRGADYLTISGPKWSATSLPPLAHNGLPPNITALWGTSDSDVFAGTYGGHIYHWNGQAWQQTHQGDPSVRRSVRALGGTGPNDVYAVGPQSMLLHFDGQAWRQLPIPGEPQTNEGFTAVLPLPDGTVFISASGNAGRLLHGNASSLSEFTHCEMPLIDMAALGERVLFATGNGVAELIGRDVQMIKSTFMTATTSPGVGRVYFIEPAQEVPCYVEFDPRETDAPWWGHEYS
jgi:hypothetical protein